jgi:hypothetical protein
VTATSAPAQVILQVKSGDAVTGLTFEFRRPIATVTGGSTLFPDNHHIVLPELEAGHDVSIHINYVQ